MMQSMQQQAGAQQLLLQPVQKGGLAPLPLLALQLQLLVLVVAMAALAVTALPPPVKLQAHQLEGSTGRRPSYRLPSCC